MRSLRLSSLFGLALVLGGGLAACGSDSSGAPPIIDAPVDHTVAPGRDAAPDVVTIVDAAVDTAAVADGGTDGVADAESAETGDAVVATTDADDDALVTPPVDAADDAVVVPPTADASGDTAPVSVSSCAMATACANFFATATGCKPANPCTLKDTGTGDNEVKNYCFDNGVKKFWSTSSPAGVSYRETTQVKKPDNSICYTKIADGKDSSGNTENWTFLDAGGAPIATAVSTSTKLTVTCGGVTYDDLGGLNCAGLEDLPSNSACTAGTCTP